MAVQERLDCEGLSLQAISGMSARANSDTLPNQLVCVGRAFLKID